MRLSIYFLYLFLFGRERGIGDEVRNELGVMIGMEWMDVMYVRYLNYTK